MYINTEKKEKEKKGQLSIMTSTKKKMGELFMVCNDNTNRERNKKKWTDSQQCASDKKKILVMSLHNTSKNIFFFIENKINRLVVR